MTQCTTLLMRLATRGFQATGPRGFSFNDYWISIYVDSRNALGKLHLKIGTFFQGSSNLISHI